MGKASSGDRISITINGGWAKTAIRDQFLLKPFVRGGGSVGFGKKLH